MAPEAAPSARLAQLREAIEKDPKSRVFVQLADEYRKAGQAGEAIAVLRRGLEHHPGYVAAWTALGKLYVESGRDSDAITSFERVLSIDPQAVVAARQLGDIHLRRGQPVEAVKRYKLVRAITPGDRELDERIEALERQIGGTPPPVAEPIVEHEMTTHLPEAAVAPAMAEPSLPEPIVPEPMAPATVESAVVAMGDDESPFDVTGGEAKASADASGGLDANDLWSESEPPTAEPPPPAEPSPDEQAAAWEAMGLSESSDSILEANRDWVSPPGASLENLAVGTESAGVSDAVGPTVTLADLYSRQGHVAEARGMLEQIRQERPADPAVLDRLSAMPANRGAAADRLLAWLHRIRTASGRPEPLVKKELTHGRL